MKEELNNVIVQCLIAEIFILSGHFSVESVDDENGNVLFFQLQFGTDQLNALAILRVRKVL